MNKSYNLTNGESLQSRVSPQPIASVTNCPKDGESLETRVFPVLTSIDTTQESNGESLETRISPVPPGLIPLSNLVDKV